MFQYFLSLKVYWAAYSTKKYNRFTATAVKKIRIMGQEMTICNTSIKLWGKNSVTRSIIAPKKSYFFPHSNCQIFFYVQLGVDKGSKSIILNNKRYFLIICYSLSK